MSIILQLPKGQTGEAGAGGCCLPPWVQACTGVTGPAGPSALEGLEDDPTAPSARGRRPSLLSRETFRENTLAMGLYGCDREQAWVSGFHSVKVFPTIDLQYLAPDFQRRDAGSNCPCRWRETLRGTSNNECCL